MPLKSKFKPQYFDDKSFRALIENITDAIALLSSEAKILYISPSAVRVLGYPPEETIGKSAFDFIHPEDAPKVQKLIKDLLKKPGTSVSSEYRMLHKDGTWRWFEGVANNLLNVSEIKAIVATYRDVTRKRNNEEKLKQSEIRNRSLIESNIIGILINEDEKIIEANDAFLDIVGYSRKDLLDGKLNWMEMTPSEYHHLSEKAFQELRETGKFVPFEKEYFCKDGTRVPVFIGGSKFQSDPLQWVTFVLDISERKELESRKDAFISMASHELKTPVTTIKVFNQLLQQRFGKAEDSTSLTYLLKMDEQINRLTELVADLLDLSKIRTGKLSLKKEEFYLNDLIEETVDYLQRQFNTHQLIIEENIKQKISGDKHRIEQVLTNLIENAVKYSPNSDKVILSSFKDGDKVIIRVKDFGIGISKKDQQMIFDRFYRVYEGEEKTYPGLGIGLYISNEIISRHGGKIWIESSKNKGSTFFASLPLTDYNFKNTQII